MSKKEIVMKVMQTGLSFEVALAQLVLGKEIRHENWEGDIYISATGPISARRNDRRLFIGQYGMTSGVFQGSWEPKQDELLSNGWQIVERWERY
jgi:hypothetical protein